MTAILTSLLGRLPIGWLQLRHKKARLASALAGVAFANILIFMQLGFLGALNTSILMPYRVMAADILISASDANTLSDGSNVARQRMYQALAVPGVRDASALYLGKLDWEAEEGKTLGLHVFGVDPNKKVFASSEINAHRDKLKLDDVVLMDRKARNLAGDFFQSVGNGRPLVFEANNRTLTVLGTFEVGAGFEADGYMIVSDQTFLRLFPKRVAGAPNHIFIDVEPGGDARRIADQIRATLPAEDTIVRPLEVAAADDQSYQTTERPVGVVFGFGIIIGVLVGIIIVYQVLSTDVADHLGEYATLKAIGYRQSFFLGIVFEEAIILALFGFIPGMIISLGLYRLVEFVTFLPMAMTGARATGVFFGTLAMCALSGAIATRRLAGADPADLF